MKVKAGFGWLCVCMSVIMVRAEEVATVVFGGMIVTMEPGAPAPIENGWMSISEEGRILEIGSGAVPESIVAKETIDAAGKIIIPGFISTHSHLWSAPFRGIASESNLYGWLDQFHTPFYPYYEEGDFYNYTLYGGLDFLSHGITACYNWVSNNGYDYDRWLGIHYLMADWLPD